jgi:glycosyltransferase involved in cell wall biosynthesis
MIKVGFIFSDGVATWNGGINYYANLMRILDETKLYEYVIFCSPKQLESFRMKFPNVKIIANDSLDGRSIRALTRKFFYYYFKRNLFIDKMLRNESIDIVSHNEIPLDKKSKIPSCGWIPDFQCFHYPNLFSKKNIKRNRFNYSYLAKYSTKIVVSSHDAEKDLINLVGPSINKKIEVFQFGLPPIKDMVELNPLILERYKVEPYKYYIISNQFWQHKNHIVVLKALKYLIDSGKKISFKIIVTGLFNDPRDPDISNLLSSFIKSNGLGDIFILTGMIPYQDVLVLQNYSIAVIQPSLFEGWNTSVEECKRIGKKILLSNLEVHLEQNPENVLFFNPKDEKDLGEKLVSVYSDFDLEQENRYREMALKNQEKKWKSFSDKYINLLNNTIKGETK